MATDNSFCRDKPVASAGSQRAGDGFTLVELIMVVAIIGILAALAIPAYGAYITKAQIARTIAELRTLEKEITIYQTDEGHFPNTLQDIRRADLMDPWGHPYQYLNIADGGIKGKGKLRRDKAINPLNTDYDLFSTGGNGLFKTPLDATESLDDIVRARDGGFIDLAEKF